MTLWVDLLIGLPLDRKIGDLQVTEELMVEILLAHQQLLKFAEKRAGLGTLYDAVIVGARRYEHLRNPKHRPRFAAGGGELGGIFHCSGSDDGALTRHQARHACEGSHRPWICQ